MCVGGEFLTFTILLYIKLESSDMENVNNTCKVGDSLTKLARFNVGLAARTDSRSEAVT